MRGEREKWICNASFAFDAGHECCECESVCVCTGSTFSQDLRADVAQLQSKAFQVMQNFGAEV